MSKRPYVIRKWTDGVRGVILEPGQERPENTYNHMVLVDQIRKVDPEAADRYREQMANGTLQIYRLVKSTETDRKYTIFYVSFTKGSDFPNHSHENAQATIMVIEGEGYVILDGERHSIKAGDMVHIPPGVAHEFFVAREGERFSYLSITEPDLVLDPFDGSTPEIDWTTHPSNRYSPGGEVEEV